MGESSGNGMADTDLYPPRLLHELDFGGQGKLFNPVISPSSPGSGLTMRPLQTADFDKGFLDLLTNLTTVGDVSQEMFEGRFEEMKTCANTYYVTVIEDLNTHQLVAAATLLMEQKFIHTAATRGRIEDVVVHPDYQGRQLGKLLLSTLTLLAKKLGCYKMSLECKDPLIKFYGKFGYVKDEGNNFMVQRFKD